MTDETPQPAPAPAPQSTPWYQSKVVIGIATAVAVQVIARVKAKYHVDLQLFGFDANDLAAWGLDAISGVAAYIALHSRITSPASPITLTKQPPSNGKP